MIKYCLILLAATAVSFPVAAAPGTNSLSAGTNTQPAAKSTAGTIPDAAHNPVLPTNTVTIRIDEPKPAADPGRLAKFPVARW